MIMADVPRVARWGKTRFPPPLKKGGTIGLVSPARWGRPEWIEEGRCVLESRGYRAAVHPQNDLRDGHMAGDAAARAGAIMEMFADPAVDAIMCVRGGGDAISILDRLDYDVVRRHPKPFIGFSDITLLSAAFARHAGLVTYHAPMIWNFAHETDPRTIEDFWHVLEHGGAERCNLSFPEAEAIRPGRAEGVLVGGNMSRLRLLMDTPFDWPSDGSILFIEEVEEVLYKIDEMLHHLRLAGRFDGVRALLVGEMVDIADGETGFARAGELPFGRDLRQVLLSHVPPDIPVAFNVPCGHGKYLTTFPVGATAQLDIVPGGGASLAWLRE